MADEDVEVVTVVDDTQLLSTERDAGAVNGLRLYYLACFVVEVAVVVSGFEVRNIVDPRGAEADEVGHGGAEQFEGPEVFLVDLGFSEESVRRVFEDAENHEGEVSERIGDADDGRVGEVGTSAV